MEFLCLNCGAVFEEPKVTYETHGFPAPPYEAFYVCPYCGGDFDEAIRCDGCGEVIRGKYYRLSGSDICYCDECIVEENTNL